MSRMRQGFTLAALVTAVVMASPSAAQDEAVPATIEAQIDVSKVAPPVSKYEFGMFIENLGTLVYRSLWSEMLDDRKFYFEISSHDPVIPVPLRARLRGRRVDLNYWHSVGPDQAVTMDKDHPFVGEHSPRIKLDGSMPHGIQQLGLALIKGKTYVGRVYLRGTPGSRVSVSLIWGDNEKDRQTVSFTVLTGAYKSYPLRFVAGANTGNGKFDITGTGTGNFHIGTVSLMPADNIDGFRPDTIALLRQLHSGFWRLPGGNFISGWSWYDSVGDIDKRPPVWD
jgi:alpha-N-arabinofuranosidase